MSLWFQGEKINGVTDWDIVGGNSEKVVSPEQQQVTYDVFFEDTVESLKGEFWPSLRSEGMISEYVIWLKIKGVISGLYRLDIAELLSMLTNW